MTRPINVDAGVRRLFELQKESCPAYTVTKGRRYKTLRFDGNAVPLFVLRENPKLRRIRELDVLGEPCALTAYAACADRLDAIMFREFDLCEWLLGSEIERLTCYRSGRSAAVLLSCFNGASASLTLHAAGFGGQSKRELFTTGGAASDRAADTLVKQNALNLFTADGEESWTDTDCNLYGLSEEQLDEAYCIFNALRDDPSGPAARAERLDRITDAAMRGERTYRAGEDF